MLAGFDMADGFSLLAVTLRCVTAYDRVTAPTQPRFGGVLAGFDMAGGFSLLAVTPLRCVTAYDRVTAYLLRYGLPGLPLTKSLGFG